MSKEPNDVLVMTTCKCREHGTNLVMTRTWFDETLQGKIAQGVKLERERVLELLRQEDKFMEHGQFNRKFFIALIKGEN